MSAETPHVLLGVMSNPKAPLLRTQWREWAAGFKEYNRGVQVRYVFGKTFYEEKVDPGQPNVVTDGHSEDHLFVDGREKLPHVGLVTEKSAYFWRTAVQLQPAASWYCKCDDDTLVNLDRLMTVLQSIDRQHPGEPSYFGHVKWRGWDVDDRFQACGGTWGDAPKTAEDILRGGIEHETHRYPPCPHAAGPYPYMSGGMVCMSRPLAVRMANDVHFGHFIDVARKRNTFGTRCRKPKICASQGPDVHMWHHEDAGVGFNVFRAIVAQNASMNYIAVPAHYNDAGIIERSVPLDANDEYWSTRAIFTHGIKRPSHFALLKQRWNLSRPVANLDNLKCHPCNLLPRGVNHHYGNWRWARVPCPSSAEGVGRFCDVQPQEHFSCCSWAWDIPPEMKTQARWRARQYKGKRSQDRLHWA